MPLSWEEITANAIAFSNRWKDARSEKSEAQSFVSAFLRVFGIEDPAAVGRFENPAKRGSNDGWMDYFCPNRIAIEMKSKGKDLTKAYQQLRDYVFSQPSDDMPELLMVSDFETIILYRRTTGTKKQFKTKDLRANVRHFAEIAGYETKREIVEQYELNLKAAEKMAMLHDALKSHGYDGHELEVYLVRLLFCMFAEDTGIFPQNFFLDYVENSEKDGSNLSQRLGKLFEVLNMTDEKRSKRTLLSSDLREFQYINGGLFHESLDTADFDAKMRLTLIECCNFNWAGISPAIFGAMFQGVMDKKLRREIGAHYTSEENILKLLKPLFLDELWADFEKVKTSERSLDEFHDRIASLKFLDPACGCGNFLIIAYRELRKLELEILKMKHGRTRQKRLDVSLLLKVNIEQFYGIEIEDFPCEIARVGMWLTDHQMNLQVSDHFGQYFARLPLNQSATIVHGNALRFHWENIVPKEELSYIIGNPPYVGYSNQSKEQKTDILSIYLDSNGKPLKTAGKIDYVSAWFYTTAKLLAGTRIRAAFVSTNSITQGEQVAAVWKPLFEMFDTHIDFAYRTFKWSNEAKSKAAVHCVIVGFSVGAGGKKIIYDGEEQTIAKNISPYLVDAPNLFVTSRNDSLCDVPVMVYGNKPADGGHLFIDGDEYDDFIAREPQSKRYIKKIYGATEFIKNIDRYCLWLVDADPSVLNTMPLVLDRIGKVRQFRLNSTKAATRASAATPGLFQEIRQSKNNFIIIPRHSSETRRWIPMGFVTPNILVNDAVQTIPDATLYHFGVLMSCVHMSWMRAVCGRLEMRYRYSKDIVYNNFPWPDATDNQKAEIEKLGQDVLDTRAKFPKSSLANLYDPLTMPKELLAVHQKVDRAVMKLYGFVKDLPESKIVAALMERYQKAVAR